MSMACDLVDATDDVQAQTSLAPDAPTDPLSAPGVLVDAPSAFVDAAPNGKQKKVHDLTFPPWPAVPEGVKLILFAAFVERGIKRHCGGADAPEVDVTGRLTVALTSAHEDDECKTDSKFKSWKPAKTKAPKRMDVSDKWWETWGEFQESMRAVRSYLHLLPDDCISQLVQEFIELHKRLWPAQGSGPTNPRALLDDFQRVIGTLDADTAPAPANDSEDEDDAPMEGVEVEGAPFVPPSSTDVVGEDFGHSNPALEAFIADPALVTRCYLSSHAKDRGHIYHEKNLLGLPKLVQFFLAFVIRSAVIKDARLQKGFADALEVAKKACIEIPKTSQIAKTMPDTMFSKGCQSLWGRKANVFHFTDDIWKAGDDGAIPLASITEVEAEPPDADAVLKGKVNPNDLLKREIDAGNLTFVTPEGDTDIQTATNTDSWGAGDDDAGGWGANTEGWGAGNDWDDDTTMADVVPEPPAYEALLALPGVAPMRETHTTGIVEHSMRRVKSVQKPAPLQPGQGEVEPARAVENALGATFARVVLEPWLEFHAGADLELNRPNILEASRGPIAQEGGDGKGHDPLKKEITVLVDVETLDKIAIGMGIAGTWVQVVRDDAGEKPVENTNAKKRKTKKADYWYMDDLIMTIPSFYSACKCTLCSSRR
ncbi:hypothetical protein BD626DRAFT_565340 [Schizophyllum amplum]|uniref:Uncharacterized protein n=1 Tax=Schizophyllum amplum TaxID=97359 RepID=A0A550CUQ0_9AGAR|nr:hypothetical protein BD626DRAFT_565340 [Auriculariopsis ampla]